MRLVADLTRTFPNHSTSVINAVERWCNDNTVEMPSRYAVIRPDQVQLCASRIPEENVLVVDGIDMLNMVPTVDAVAPGVAARLLARLTQAEPVTLMSHSWAVFRLATIRAYPFAITTVSLSDLTAELGNNSDATPQPSVIGLIDEGVQALETMVKRGQLATRVRLSDMLRPLAEIEPRLRPTVPGRIGMIVNEGVRRKLVHRFMDDRTEWVIAYTERSHDGVERDVGPDHLEPDPAPVKLARRESTYGIRTNDERAALRIALQNTLKQQNLGPFAAVRSQLFTTFERMLNQVEQPIAVTELCANVVEHIISDADVAAVSPVRARFLLPFMLKLISTADMLTDRDGENAVVEPYGFGCYISGADTLLHPDWPTRTDTVLVGALVASGIRIYMSDSADIVDLLFDPAERGSARLMQVMEHLITESRIAIDAHTGAIVPSSSAPHRRFHAL